MDVKRVKREEVLRYADHKTSAVADSRLSEYVEWALDELEEKCRPKWVYRLIDVSKILEEFPSEDLAKALSGCDRGVIMGATLGVEADMLISRASRRDMGRGLIMEAAATAYIEAFCDECEEKLKLELAADDSAYKRCTESENDPAFQLGRRFSPGYGDFAIEHQRKIISLLDAPRKIGLTLTDSLMMAPAKSVTAVIGIKTGAIGGSSETGATGDCSTDTGFSCDDGERTGCENRCNFCTKTDCAYRRMK